MNRFYRTKTDYSLKCPYCDARHFFYERLSSSTNTKHVFPDLCCTKGKYKPTIREAPLYLEILLRSESKLATHFRKHIRAYNNAFALASVQANWVSRGKGGSSWNPTITVQGKMYHLMGGLNPPEGKEPRYASLYVYDTETSNAHRKHFDKSLKDEILGHLDRILKANNNLVKSFVNVNDLIKSGQIPEDVDLVIHAHKRNPDDHDRKYNLPQASEVALIATNENCGSIDIKLRHRGTLNDNGHEKLYSIHMGHRIYDPAAFPLLFPYGEEGWHSQLTYDTAPHEPKAGKLKKVSPLKFYGRFLFSRKNKFSILLNSGRLFQQYLTEAFYKIENERLSWLRANQSQFRSADFTKLHEHVGDAMTSGNEVDLITSADNIGKVVILPPTHIGSERYMRQKMHDIIAISNNIGHPDLFITLTCNPKWKEIETALLPGQKASDRPDLCNRVFRMKHQHLIKYLRSGKPFGKVAAFASVIEFQKRVLVHAHIIIILSAEAKERILNPANVDKLLSAEIPMDYSVLRDTFLQHMIQRPCKEDPRASCLKHETGKCSKRYPMAFKDETAASEGDYYMSYKRRSPENGGAKVDMKMRVGNKYEKFQIDNSWVVPHCPTLLAMYRSHMNVELCISRIGSIKYLFKYICKGPDRITVELKKQSSKVAPESKGVASVERDEISLFQDARYYSASESAWRLFKFPMVEHFPPIERLSVHLEDQQKIYFKRGEELLAAETGKDKATPLMAWFDANVLYQEASHIRFMDFPKYFRWDSADRVWKPRNKFATKNMEPKAAQYDFTGNGEPNIGRMYSVSPRERERYFLRTLLLHKSGAKSFEDMRTIDGVVHESFQDACSAMGLLADDGEWYRCLEDAIKNKFEPLPEVFATILAYCEISNPKAIWERFTPQFIDDIRHRHPESMLQNDNVAQEYCLLEVKTALECMNVDFANFGLPQPDSSLSPLIDTADTSTDTSQDIEAFVTDAAKSFNNEQKGVFNTIVGEILPGTTSDLLYYPVKTVPKSKGRNRAYFLDAPGGTGKTFVIRAIQALLKLRERTTVTVASSAVAASLLDGGRTAHSTFKIPIPCFEDSVCNISLETKLAVKIRDADLIIWDEVVMSHRTNIEALNRTLKTIMDDQSTLFGGKLILFSGDFRQILPVVPRGSRGMIVNACLKSSSLFASLRTLQLKTNMRLESLKKDKNADPAALLYPQYLLDVGEGNLEMDKDDFINLPSSLNVEKTCDDLICSVFPDLTSNFSNEDWIKSRAILATTNARLHELNEEIGDRFPGSYRNFISADSVTSDDDHEAKSLELKYPPELLNSMPGNANLPDHTLNLKTGFIVMLLRNIRPLEGHVNGTRYIVQNMTKNILLLKSVSGSHPGRQFVLPRMNCIPGKQDYPIPGFRRRQFPIRVCFAMTINKSQGQSVSGKLGIDLTSNCFSHGQLYVALSRTTHPSNVHILLNTTETKTRNVVYSEVFGAKRTRAILPAIGNVNPTSAVHFKKLNEPCARVERDSVCNGSNVRIYDLMKKENIAVTKLPSLEVIDVDKLPTPGNLSTDTSRNTLCKNIPLWRSDLHSVLTPETLVTDNPIEACMRLFSQSNRIHQWPPQIPSILYDSDYSFETYIRNISTEINKLNACEIILAPINDNNIHWGLAICDKTNRTIYIYDSVHSRQNRSTYFKREIRFLRNWCNTLSTTYPQLRHWPSGWRTTRTYRSPLQHNPFDCGIFTILNAFFYVNGVSDPNYSQLDINNYRRQIYEALINENINKLSL